MISTMNYMQELVKYVEELVKVYRPKGLIIAVAGPAASGKTTGAKALAEAFGLKYHSVGSIFREKAEKLGISIEELSKTRSDELDLEADKETLRRMMEGDVVIEGRLVGILATLIKHIEKDGEVAIVRMLYNPPLKVRAERHSQRESIPYDASLNMIIERDKADKEKYSKMYGIEDFTDPKYYDIILDNSEWSPEDAKIEPVKILISYLKEKDQLRFVKVEPLLEYSKKMGLSVF